jgi:DNA primase
LAAAGDLKAQVLQATDIVEVIGQSVALKRRGKSFVGLCPFHQEKTPSFHVDQAKQFFHCFGCKASGNAIDFVIKRDRVEFIDALRLLAERAGIEFRRTGGADRDRASERQMLYDAHSAACGLFENWLSDSETGAASRAYLEKRGFNAQAIKQFRIGLAPDSWDALLKSPPMRKFPPGVLATAGLVKARQNGEGFYDTFRNRVMFPIFEEAQARIIAFGGRVMPGSEDPAKYLNSPETPLFSKSRCVYGLNFARQRMIESGVAVVVEGYTDVVMAHQFGATNVVSVLGTAMTEQHVNVLRRFARKIVLLFDADEAGDLAVNRAVELFLTQDVEIAIASMPDGVDPDEYLIAHGAQAFENQVIGQAKDVLAFKWSQMMRQFKASGDDLTGRQKAVEAYLELLASARESGAMDQLRWGGVLSRVSRLTEMTVDDLHRRFRKSLPRSRPAAEQERPATEASSPRPNDMGISPARELAERQILGILLVEPRRWHQLQVTVHPEDFLENRRRRLAEIYWHHQQDVGEPVFAELLGMLDEPDLKELTVELVEMVQQLPEERVEETLKGVVTYLEEERRRSQEQKQLAELRRISQQQDSVGPEDEAAKFAAFVKNNQSLNLRRVGPIRRRTP